MSTLSGNATKGEKGKKFQQLKINLCTANKPSEPEQQQHKSSIQRKQHGMTSLGKVPTARRPTNLPSEKSEHSGNDPSINLVPSGGAGWGNKQNESGSTTPSLVQTSNPPTNVAVNNVSMDGTSQQVQHAQHYPPTSRMPPMSQVGHAAVHHGHTDVKTWAMRTQSADSSAPNFFAPQSPLFQHEFPSLSANSETTAATTPATATATQKTAANAAADTQYGPGPSLRPQTEGSWIQGGSRPQGSTVPAAGNASAPAPVPVRPTGPYPVPLGTDGVRNNLGPSGVGVVQGGPYPPPQHMIPPQFNGMMPAFMLRGPYPPGGFPPNFQPSVKGVGPRAPYGAPYMPSGPPAPGERFGPQSGSNSGKRSYDDEDVKIGPIVREEDLNQMTEMGNDIDWAGHSTMDYSKKLYFSDDEDEGKNKENQCKTRSKTQVSSKGNEKGTEKKSNENENDVRSSKENLKEREKLFVSDARPPEVKNAWHIRRPLMQTAAPPTSRYQIPAGRFEEDDDAWQEKRRQKKEEMEIIVQRAKERKEEEEKRFIEQQQAAALKLKKLEAKILAQAENGESFDSQSLASFDDETRKNQNVAPIPVVKDASEFRELTQLVDRSTFVKKETKERENNSQSFSRSYQTNNVAPRFQNLNRQNSTGGLSSNTSRSNVPQQLQFSSKQNSGGFGSSRHGRLDSESMSEKDRDWAQEDARKDRDGDRYSKESLAEREYGYDREDNRKYENRFAKEYESKRRCYGEKDEYGGDSYSRSYEKEIKSERKNSESEKEKSKNYDHHRYVDDGQDGRWRLYDTTSEKRSFATSPKVSRTFSESENLERKRSREEAYENLKTNNAEREREYYRKDGSNREKTVTETERESEKSRDDDSKRNKEFDSSKIQENEKANVYEERLNRGSELREGRYHRESRESLREEYSMQDQRSYSWTDDTEIEEKVKPARRDHYREERGDRYSHAQRHPPGPITRAKLEAKELESESKRNLTPLIRSDKKVELRELRKSENDDSKVKEKSEKSSIPEAKTTESTTATSKSESHAGENQPAWKKEDSSKSQTSQLSNEQGHDIKENAKDKVEKKDAIGKGASSTSKVDDTDKSNAEDKRNDRRKVNERRSKATAATDSRWVRYSVYHGSAYGNGRANDSKSRRLTRGPTMKITPRHDSKFSESDFSDEISESGRDDRSRGDRDKLRSTKPSTSMKRYDRDDRNRDYRMDDRDYMGGGSNRSRNTRDTYYYSTKQTQRGRAGFRNSLTVSKRTDGYAPQSSTVASVKNSSGNASHATEDKRSKQHSSKESALSTENNYTADTKKSESSNISKSNSKSSMVDRNWKRNYDNVQLEAKSTVSSPTSTQTAEANEESFATASEGTDSEETMVHMQKNKSNYPSTKRSTVVVAKPQRKSYRSTSRKRYDVRRTAPTHTRKDSGSYSGSKSTFTGSVKMSTVGKENERMNNEASFDRAAKDDGKSTSEKLQKEYSDSQSRRNVKPRNKSNTRRTSTVSASNSRSGGKQGQDSSFRTQSGKPKTVDGRFGVIDGKETKSSSDISVPHMREVGGPIPAPPPAGNAWDKPLTGTLRNGTVSTLKANVVGASTASMSTTNTTTTVILQEKSIVQITEQHSESSPLSSEMSASSTLSAEKVTTKVLENLDGATPPVQTIIFENTNFKSGPSDLGGKSKYATQLKSHRFDKDSKLDGMDASVAFGNDTNADLTASKHDSLQMALFNKNEDLDFTFDSEFSKLTEDKTAKAMELTHAMHIVQASTDADLNFKIASVKKVWDERLTEHFDDKYDAGGLVNSSTSFPPSFNNHSSDPSNGSCYGNSHVDASGHVQVDDVSLGHGEVVFNPQMQASAYGSNCQAVVMKNDSAASSNVCKVKPQPQGATMANVAQSSVISTTMVSQPPPLSSPSFNAFSCSTPQPNLNNNAIAATALAQMNFQQYSSMPNMPPPVPSSPVLFNSSQTPAPAPPGVYQTFQIDNSQVASRAPYGQFASYGLSAGGGIGQTSAFNHQQSLFVTPPTNAPPPEIYSQQMPQFRIQPQTFGNSSQITNHNTVLISSSSNSLMSATIKPSNQQISAIGTKAGYQTTQNSPQVYLSLDPNTPLLGQNFLPGGQLIQRPANNVVPAPSLPASTSYYSSASGAGQTGFFPPGTNSALPQPGNPAMGLTAAAFNTQSATQSLTAAGLQNFNAQQLTQQYRSATQPSYLTKSGNTSNIMSDFVSNKTMTIPSQHDVMNPCFQPVGSQMTSNKQRLQSGGKNVPTVQQAMAQHSMQQNAYGYQSQNQMRNNSGGGGGGANKGSQYPHPIQRPVSQGNSSNRSGGNNANNSSSSSHRMSSARNNSHLVNNIQQPPSSVYYSASSGYSSSAPKLETSQLDSKTDSTADSKLADSIKTINSKNNAATTEKTVSSNE